MAKYFTPYLVEISQVQSSQVRTGVEQKVFVKRALKGWLGAQHVSKEPVQLGYQLGRDSRSGLDQLQGGSCVAIPIRLKDVVQERARAFAADGPCIALASDW